MRKIHELTPQEMEIVSQYIEMGLAEDEQEALDLALESGEISDTKAKGGSFMPEGFEELKFSSGHQKSKFTLSNKQAKKDKTKDWTEFEEGVYYLGTEIPKDKETGKFELEKVKHGINVGDKPEVIITHIYYSGFRYVPNANDNVSTTFKTDMTFKSQKNMIDFKSKKSFYDIRQALKEEFGEDKKNTPEARRVNFQFNVYGLVKTEDGLKPFFTTAKIGHPDYSLLNDFIEDIKGTPISRVLAEINVKDDGEGGYTKKVEKKDIIDSDTFKKDYATSVKDNLVKVSKFITEQKNAVKTSEDTSSQQDIDVDEEEDPFA